MKSGPTINISCFEMLENFNWSICWKAYLLRGLQLAISKDVVHDFFRLNIDKLTVAGSLLGLMSFDVFVAVIHTW